MAKLSKPEIEHLLDLSRIKISAEEIENYNKDLSMILDYVKDLEKAPIANIKSEADELKNITRADKITPSLPTAKVLENAPLKKDNFIKVEKVFE